MRSDFALCSVTVDGGGQGFCSRDQFERLLNMVM